MHICKESCFQERITSLCAKSQRTTMVCLSSYANLQQIGFSYRPIQFHNIGREIETVINRCQSWITMQRRTMDDDDSRVERELQREMPEVDERAVTKYGSQRLVNNGALRRCSTSSTTMTSTLTRSRFTNTLKTLESSNSGSWQWNHWHSFANIHRRSFRTHRLSTSICHTSIVSKRRETTKERAK